MGEMHLDITLNHDLVHRRHRRPAREPTREEFRRHFEIDAWNADPASTDSPRGTPTERGKTLHDRDGLVLPAWRSLQGDLRGRRGFLLAASRGLGLRRRSH